MAKANQQPSNQWFTRAYRFLYEVNFEEPASNDLDSAGLRLCSRCAKNVFIHADHLRRDQFSSLVSMLSTTDRGRIGYLGESKWVTPDWCFLEPRWVNDDWLLTNILANLALTPVTTTNDLRPKLAEKGSPLSLISQNKITKWNLSETIKGIQEFTEGSWQQISQRFGIGNEEVDGWTTPEVLNWALMPITMGDTQEQPLTHHHLSFQWACSKEAKELMVFRLIVHRIEEDSFGVSILQRKISFEEEGNKEQDILRDLPYMDQMN